MNYQIDAMCPDDWPEVRRIYTEGIATGNATFETEVPSWEAWNATRRQEARLVARVAEGLLGFAALSAVSSRPVYGGVAEASVYVATAARGHGVGTALLNALIIETETAGIWTLQGGIFPENEVSLALVAKSGFRTVGTRQRIGQMDRRWRDVVLVERRSDRVGIS